MAGRAGDTFKRFDLGIKAMVSIINEIPICLMNIISFPCSILQKLIRKLNLDENVNFTGFIKDPSIYYRNASLHIMPSLTESYAMVLAETKIFGIPSILCGLDYLSLSKKGTIILYDDSPDIIAKEAIKILKNDTYRKSLGKEARESMKKKNNKFIVQKWVNLLLAIYKGEEYYNKLRNNSEQISQSEIDIILNNQLKLLKKKIPIFRAKSLPKLKSILMNIL